MLILGLNAYHGDSSACILKNGQLIAAVEEERFSRIKHWAGFPMNSIQYCLDEAQVELEDIDHIAVNRNPKANLMNKALFMLRKQPSIDMIKDRLKNALKVKDIRDTTSKAFRSDPINLTAQVHHVEHHVSHLASAFMVSPFDKAAVVSVDGFGDFVGCMWGEGKANRLDIRERIYFPHSLGLYYLALTQYLGFPNYGDEYKVMGLAAFGEPSQMDKMRKIVQLNSKGQFELGLDYFTHHSEGVTMTWESGQPDMGPVYSSELERLLGPSRNREGTIDKRHEDIAASLQAMYEEAFFHLLNEVYKKTKNPNVCLAGGCAMNSVANGKIFDMTPFEEVYIQPAAGDAGGAIGAAFYVWHQHFNQPRDFVMHSAYWGPGFGEAELKQYIEAKKSELTNENCTIEIVSDQLELCKKTAKEIAAGKVVGWFQGRMEWGPRALGNRSIVVDPRKAEMQDVLNARIKRRELFRPFAPSILLESVGEYFEKDYPDPFMIKVYPIKPEKRAVIPAVTHVDGSGRLQTVRRNDNPLYWQLIKEFDNITGVPVVLNTSFNENEPIVCNPTEALECFIRTKMDVLAMGNVIIRHSS